MQTTTTCFYFITLWTGSCLLLTESKAWSSGSGVPIQLTFEDGDGGFLLREPSGTGTKRQSDSIVSRFTVLPGLSSELPALRATYGPFSTKQSILPQYVTVPEIGAGNYSSANPDLGVSAHICQREVSRDNPVLRVLVHGVRSAILCATVEVSLAGEQNIRTTCSSHPESGVCLAQIIIPWNWWPATHLTASVGKTPKRLVQVQYSVQVKDSEECLPSQQVSVSAQRLPDVMLVAAVTPYREHKADDTVFAMQPMMQVYPLSKLYMPFVVRTKFNQGYDAIVIKGKVKSGLRILNAIASSNNRWNVTFSCNSKNTAASVILIPNLEFHGADSQSDNDRMDEAFHWLLEVERDSVDEDSLWGVEAKIIWSIHYMRRAREADFSKSSVENDKPRGMQVVSPQNWLKPIERKKRKIVSRFDVRKDITEAIVPVSKSWEMVNTAMLTGKQVSQPMKVYVISKSGSVADVTRQCGCLADDETVLKVTSSCSSVYVDGSEIRGSTNATVTVKYESQIGVATFTVWVPEINELELAVSDVRLNKIKDWMIPHADWDAGKLFDDKKKKKVVPSKIYPEKGKAGCTPMYQRATIDVYSKFKATDHNSGMASYLLGRKIWLRITDLVDAQFRISDLQVMTLNGHTLLGRNPGRAEIQVISPISGHIIVNKEVRVLDEEVHVRKISASVVSGIQMKISPDNFLRNSFLTSVQLFNTLNTRYQEGLLNVQIEYSDDTYIWLNDLKSNHYHLSVESTRPDVLAFAPVMSSSYPRIIALSPDSGKFLKVALRGTDTCNLGGTSSDAAFTMAFVNINFDNPDYKASFQLAKQELSETQSFELSPPDGDSDLNLNNLGNGDNLISAVAATKELNDDPSSYTDSNRGRYKPEPDDNIAFKKRRANSGDSLGVFELSLVAFLSVFFVVMVFFMIALFLCTYDRCYGSDVHNAFEPTYSRRFFSLGAYKPLAFATRRLHEMENQPSTTNAHDWVWLGRATVERASGAIIPASTRPMRITENPAFGSPLPLFGNRRNLPPIDTTTFWKDKKPLIKSRKHRAEETDLASSESPSPPPVPPHGIPKRNKRHDKSNGKCKHARRPLPHKDFPNVCKVLSTEGKEVFMSEEEQECNNNMRGKLRNLEGMKFRDEVKRRPRPVIQDWNHFTDDIKDYNADADFNMDSFSGYKDEASFDEIKIEKFPFYDTELADWRDAGKKEIRGRGDGGDDNDQRRPGKDFVRQVQIRDRKYNVPKKALNPTRLIMSENGEIRFLSDKREQDEEKSEFSEFEKIMRSEEEREIGLRGESRMKKRQEMGRNVGEMRGNALIDSRAATNPIGDVKRANLVENPLFFEELGVYSEDENDIAKDYREFVNYFTNLKESYA